MYHEKQKNEQKIFDRVHLYYILKSLFFLERERESNKL